MSLQELLGFLDDERADVRLIALSNVVPMSGSEEGIAQLKEGEITKHLGALLKRWDHEDQQVSQLVLALLCNLSGEVGISHALVLEHRVIARHLVPYLLETPGCAPRIALMLLTNLLRVGEEALKQMMEGGENRTWVKLLTRVLTGGDEWVWGAAVFHTASAHSLEVRKLFLDEQTTVVRRMCDALCSDDAPADDVIIMGYCGVFKNLLMHHKDRHGWLVGQGVLEAVLGQLIRGDHGMSPDEVRSLPLSIRERAFADTHKWAPPLDADVRLCLVECVHLMLLEKDVCEQVKAAGAYAVLRELHDVEKDPRVTEAIELQIEALLLEREDE